MLINCTAMDEFRNNCEIGQFISMHKRSQPLISSAKLYSLFLNNSLCNNLKKRILSLYHMKIGWCRLMGIDM